ncbi:hypothetical protein FRC12_006282 [Ceratobasidium sp. 428]|nr:hypothetical protein FRC12_006282 [Ceratobasidium sp. 428]
MAELLAWPIIERIVENDTSPEDAETGFIETREEFDAAVVDWRTKVEQDLVDIWGAGRTEDDGTEAKSESSTGKGKGKAAARTGAGRNTRKTKERVPAVELSASETSRDPIELVLPEFTVTFTKPDGTTATNLSDLSPNLQILLRADTMFKAGPHHSYPGVVSPGGQPRRITRASGEELCGKRYRWNAEEVKHDDEASTLAKVLLAKVGRSGATTAEMQALRARFRCGRCTQTLPETWESLVFHYHKEQTNWKQARDKIHENPQFNFVYHNIHDLELGSSKPFAHFMTPEATINFALGSAAHELHVMTCMPCERMDIQAKHLHWFYSYAETPMVHHLLHVHDIARPICGTHYERRAYFANRFDDEDTDEDEFWV